MTSIPGEKYLSRIFKNIYFRAHSCGQGIMPASKSAARPTKKTQRTQKEKKSLLWVVVLLCFSTRALFSLSSLGASDGGENTALGGWSQRPEIATPPTSLARLRECVFLLQLAQTQQNQQEEFSRERKGEKQDEKSLLRAPIVSGVRSIYAGDQCHHPTLLVYAAAVVESLAEALPSTQYEINWSPWLWRAIFFSVDALGAVFVVHCAAAWQRQQVCPPFPPFSSFPSLSSLFLTLGFPSQKRERSMSSQTSGSGEMSWWFRNGAIDSPRLPLVAGLLYTLNPFGIVSALGLTTAVINNTLVLGCIRFASGARARAREAWLACLFLACASYVSVYPLLLIPALANVMRISVTGTALLVLSGLAALFFASDLLLRLSGGMDHDGGLVGGDFSMITETWGSVLAVTDLTPNLGLFWYLFTEVFDHFQPFYLFVYQVRVCLVCVLACRPEQDRAGDLFFTFFMCADSWSPPHFLLLPVPHCDLHASAVFPVPAPAAVYVLDAAGDYQLIQGLSGPRRHHTRLGVAATDV
jgi:GPI transamidase subunit PIG-U